MKVIAINGSPRSDGNTALMIHTVLKELDKAGIGGEFVQIGGKEFHGCRACYSCFKNKDNRCVQEEDMVNSLIRKMEQSDGILLGSPVYFSDVTPEMKAFLDRSGFVAMANGGLFRRKAGAGIVAVRRAGALHTLDTLNHFFLISQMIIPGSVYWNLGMGKNPGEVKNDTEGVRTMKILGRNLAWLIKKIHT